MWFWARGGSTTTREKWWKYHQVGRWSRGVLAVSTLEFSPRHHLTHRKVSGVTWGHGRRPKNRSPQQCKGGKRSLWLPAVVLWLCGWSGPGVCRCLAVGPGLASFVVAWSFPFALVSSRGTFCGRAPTQEPRAVGYFRCLCTPSRCMVWWRRHGDCMGLVEICLIVVLSIPLLVAYSIRVPFSLCHLEGISWKYQCGTFDTSRSTRRHKEAVANRRQQLTSRIHCRSRSRVFCPVILPWCSVSSTFWPPPQKGLWVIYAVMGLSKAVQLSSA